MGLVLGEMSGIVWVDLGFRSLSWFGLFCVVLVMLLSDLVNL